MSVVIGKRGTYKTAVNFEVLEDSGKKKNCSFQAEFKRMSASEIRELLEQRLSDAELCKRVIVGWKFARDDTGEDWPFTLENFEKFLDEPGYSGITALRFFETVGGSREKN